MKKLLVKTKKAIKDNSNKIWLTGTGIAAIGFAYLVGRVQGEANVVVNLTTLDKDGNIITQELPEAK